MADDIVINKAAAIERCLARIREEYADDPRTLRGNQTKQDAIVLNLMRACEAAIDLAMHLVAALHLGVPQETREAFAMLVEAAALPPELGDRLKRMVGFRNIAVHDYRALSVEIVERIVRERLGDFTDFTAWALRRS